jgi:hypothetical protein
MKTILVFGRRFKQHAGVQRKCFGQTVTAFWKQRPGGRLSWLETIMMALLFTSLRRCRS